VEVFRPRIDRAVKGALDAGICQIDRPVKELILSILSEPVTIAGSVGPLMVSLNRMLASLVRCYEGEQKLLDLPE
jgi:hypothetical protein